MHTDPLVPEPYPGGLVAADNIEASGPGVSWAAVLAGAAAAAALSLILLILGSGLGFAAMSPWAQSGAQAASLGIAAIVWLGVTQILASGLGGYLAGRLRVKWTATHGDEVYFRDTAHGLLSWAVATLVTAAFLGSALSGIAAAGADMTSRVAAPALAAAAAGTAGASSDAAQSSDDNGPMTYFVDTLFRTDDPVPSGDVQRDTRQATVIFATSLRQGVLADEDKAYLSRLVASRTGLGQEEAENRVTEVYTRTRDTLADMQVQAKQAADTARKTAATTALWMFVALLCGAFFASLAGVYGGRQRDAVI